MEYIRGGEGTTQNKEEQREKERSVREHKEQETIEGECIKRKTRNKEEKVGKGEKGEYYRQGEDGIIIEKGRERGGEGDSEDESIIRGEGRGGYGGIES